MDDIKMINCPKCEGKMPELRLIKFGYNFCVDCSTEKPLKALSITGGDGDHTYNTIQVITSDQYDSIKRQEELNKNIKFGDAES
jgi:hypothetical protein|tara:strand:- start:21 stop:272 length:252 start_codon:yes stop_codon:yes gene_type:complete